MLIDVLRACAFVWLCATGVAAGAANGTSLVGQRVLRLSAKLAACESALAGRNAELDALTSAPGFSEKDKGTAEAKKYRSLLAAKHEEERRVQELRRKLRDMEKDSSDDDSDNAPRTARQRRASGRTQGRDAPGASQGSNKGGRGVRDNRAGPSTGKALSASDDEGGVLSGCDTSDRGALSSTAPASGGGASRQGSAAGIAAASSSGYASGADRHGEGHQRSSPPSSQAYHRSRERERSRSRSRSSRSSDDERTDKAERHGRRSQPGGRRTSSVRASSRSRSRSPARESRRRRSSHRSSRAERHRRSRRRSSRARSHSPGASRSSESSRSRSRSRSSRSSSRGSSSRSNSRSRGRDNRRVQLLRPDPLAPDYMPLKASTVDKLLEGTYVHINKLLRQNTRSADPARSKHTEKLGQLSVSMGQQQTKRVVTTALDWLEAYTSSVLPAQVQAAHECAAAANSSELDEKHEQLRQSCVYVVAAISYFRKYPNAPAQTVVDYLESHRQTCGDSGADLSQPDNSMLVGVFASLSASDPAGSSAAAAGHAHAPASGGMPKRYDHCGLYNRTGVCPYGNKCKFPHSCSVCKQQGHWRGECKSANEQGSAGGSGRRGSAKK